MNRLATLRWATWLGWQVESNWTRPWLFVLYMVLKPFAGSLLLVVMFQAVRLASGAVPAALLPYIYVGNACYALIGSVAFGICNAVISDREHYRMLKYVYVSPAHLRSYFIGRGLARVGEAVVGAGVNLTLGVLLFPEVRAAFSPENVRPLWAVVFFLLGVVLLVSLGLMLAAVVLNMAKHGMFLSEGVAGMLYLLSGAVFPLAVLPGWLQAVSLTLPPTYWLEGMRRSLTGAAGSPLPSPLADWSLPALAAALAASAAVFAVAAHFVFQWGERRAWRKGRIEETTGM